MKNILFKFPHNWNPKNIGEHEVGIYFRPGFWNSVGVAIKSGVERTKIGDPVTDTIRNDVDSLAPELHLIEVWRLWLPRYVYVRANEL